MGEIRPSSLRARGLSVTFFISISYLSDFKMLGLSTLNRLLKQSDAAVAAAAVSVPNNPLCL